MVAEVLRSGSCIVVMPITDWSTDQEDHEEICLSRVLAIAPRVPLSPSQIDVTRVMSVSLSPSHNRTGTRICKSRAKYIQHGQIANVGRKLRVSSSPLEGHVRRSVEAPKPCETCQAFTIPTYADRWITTYQNCVVAADHASLPPSSYGYNAHKCLHHGSNFVA